MWPETLFSNNITLGSLFNFATAEGQNLVFSYLKTKASGAVFPTHTLVTVLLPYQTLNSTR